MATCLDASSSLVSSSLLPPQPRAHSFTSAPRACLPVSRPLASKAPPSTRPLSTRLSAPSSRLPSSLQFPGARSSSSRQLGAVGGVTTRKFRDVAARAELAETATESPSSSSSSSSSSSAKSASELVDELLEAIEGTDRGASSDEATRERVNALAAQLEQLGMPEPLQSPLVFGNWAVGYTSSPTAAGGGYRSVIGRVLLQTEQMEQSIAPPNAVGNLVSFRALSAVPGKVTLQGVFKALDSKWVEVTFEPPTLELGPWSFNYGGQSQVKLAVTYLDERVRLGRGSRGSLFVFLRLN